MQDIYFDFDNNDIKFNEHDLFIAYPCSLQNGAMFFSKSCVDLNNAGKGIGFKEIGILCNQNEANRLASECVDQLYNDGAQSANIDITVLETFGEYQYDLSVRYKQETSNE